MKFTLMIALSTLMTFSCFATEGKTKGRKPSEEGQKCVTFNGEGAKKTFVALYPYTQGNVTAIAAEETRSGETNISTPNIFCRVSKVGLAGNLKKLNAIKANQFQCGYFISSDGELTACSDPM